ncbi:alpha/beta-hydrolase [Mycena maculata]|uniref:feruloyl esterase n=1 Tax=Mycena maculata TaxID=230809 RepID=A0AAD7JIK7_9AGAR|nr:alpha/beta-hydrolase [Mycena maculata]
MLFISLSLLLASVHALPHRRIAAKHSLGAAYAVPAPSRAPGNATAGCRSASSWKFDDTNHANITLGDRSFLVHIPTTYHPTTQHALVVSYHGFKANDVKQEEITGFSEEGLTLNGRGLVAVYPNGQFGPGKDGNESIRAWEGAPYSPPGVDDIAFTQQMVQSLSDNLCLDSNRFYASGKSNGGGLTNLLACTPATAKLFAAFAPVSAALYAGANPQNCKPGRAVPIINFHGLADTIIPFDGQAADKEGRTEYATPNITQYREAWADRNGCIYLPPADSSSTTLGVFAVVSHPHVNTTLKTSNCSAVNTHTVVNGFTVADLGHSWPTTLGLDGGGITTFNATTANILPFFDSQSMEMD